MNQNISLMKKIFVIGLIVAPIINQYEFPGMSYFEFFAIFSLMIYLFNSRKIHINRYAKFSLVCFEVSVLSTILFMFMFPDMGMSLVSIVLRWIKYIFVLLGIGIGSQRLLDISYAKKIYTVVVIFATTLLVCQYIIYISYDICIYALLPNVSLNYNDGMNSSIFMSSLVERVKAGYYYRPSSFFIEPAMYALYVLPLLAIYLSKSFKSKKDVLLTIFITFGVMLTTSSLGIVGCIMLWGIYLIKYFRQIGYSRKKILYLPLLLFLLVIGLSFVLSNELIMISIQGKIRSFGNLDQASSLTLRLLRGGYFYKEMDFLNQIIGVGYGNLSAYYYAKNMSLIYDSGLTEVSYMSGIFTILCSFGIIGLISFIIWLVKTFKNNKSEVKCLIAVLLLCLFVSDYFDSASYWMIIAFIIGIESIKEIENIK